MRSKLLKASFLFLIFLPSLLSAESIRSKVQKGNELFAQGKYEQALAAYKDALLDDPTNEIVLFNQGNAYYKMKKYDEALQAYQKVVASENLELSAKAFFNIGNVYFRQNKLKESIEAYKKALELFPNDREAKYNLELARARLKELAKKQPRSDQPQQNKPIQPSEFAKKLKEQAEKLVEQFRYQEALQLMENGLKKDPTVAAFQAFINRIRDVVEILGSDNA